MCKPLHNAQEIRDFANEIVDEGTVKWVEVLVPVTDEMISNVAPEQFAQAMDSLQIWDGKNYGPVGWSDEIDNLSQHAEEIVAADIATGHMFLVGHYAPEFMFALFAMAKGDAHMSFRDPLL